MFATLELPLRDDCRHKRLKVGRACQPCRMKKIKCDGKQPCMQCKARRRTCVYSKNADESYIKLEPIDNTSTLSDTFLQDIAERAQEQEQQYSGLSNKVSGDALCASTVSAEDNTVRPPQVSTRPDKLVEQLTDGLFRLTLNGDGPAVMGEMTTWRDYGDLVRWSPEPSLPSSYLASIDMPTRTAQENLIQVFFSQCHPSILPSFSRQMFFDQLSVKGPLVTPLLLNMLYAHAAKHVPTLQGSLFYNRARRLVDDFLDVPRVSTVIALLYMVSYDHDDAAWSSSRAWMYCGMAVRMCLDLGLHTSNYSSRMSQFDIELRKRILWTCYVMDKWTSCMAERPWMMRAKDISLDFPAPMPEDDPEERTVLEGFVYLCRLMILIERVTEFFAYEAKKEHGWNMEHESEIIRFLNEVEQWRDSLPDTLQPPTSNIIHLVGYNLELSLIMCCRYQDEQVHQERRRSLANTITHLVSVVLQQQQPQTILTFSLTAFIAIFATLIHATDPAIAVAQNVQLQFHTSLQHVRRLLTSKRNLNRLIDMTLNPGYVNGSSSSSSSAFKETSTVTSPSSSSFEPSSAAAAKEAAAAAIGAVGAPAFEPHKTVEPGDYTFELISVADEWARSLIYPS